MNPGDFSRSYYRSSACIKNVCRALRLLLLSCFALALIACSATHDALSSQALKPADTIFIGKHIVSVDEDLPNPEAVAVRGEKIIAVGSAKAIMKQRGVKTRVVQLGSKALVPGFIDAHGHLGLYSRFIDFANLSSPPVGPVSSINDMRAVLAAHIKQRTIEPGNWVMGYSYDDSLLQEKRHPTRYDLDKISTEHPIVLMHVSGHLVAVNSKALALSDVSATTENPPGGVIRRFAGGTEPNGVVEEAAIYPFVIEQLGEVAPDKLNALVSKALDVYASYGITTVQDGAASLTDINVMRANAANKEYPLDIVAYPVGTMLGEQGVADLGVSQQYRGGFRVGGIKLMLDGSPQGRTAFLSRPYKEGPPGAAADYRAYPSMPAETFNPIVEKLLDTGVPTIVHANGDAAIEMMIDGVAAAINAENMPDHRSVIIHAQLMREDQLHRVKALGLMPSYYAVHPFFWGDWHRKSFGDERASFISPLARTTELGIPFTIHNDTPVVPPDMIRLMWIAVNRETRSGYVLGPDQRVGAEHALHAITQAAAYQYFEEQYKGSITLGKQADLVILSSNPVAVAPDEIKSIQVVETFARGRSVYQRP
ncbi:MAG: amidohydrolase [Pseudomonadales bacterium]|nr:MAG: amidohydrolase [Pseudomonadales bacterium]